MEVLGFKHVRLSNRYRTAIIEGHYKSSGYWAKEMTGRIKVEGEALKNLFYYTTCLKCAEAYGKNYVVLLGRCDLSAAPPSGCRWPPANTIEPMTPDVD